MLGFSPTAANSIVLTYLDIACSASIALETYKTRNSESSNITERLLSAPKISTIARILLKFSRYFERVTLVFLVLTSLCACSSWIIVITSNFAAINQIVPLPAWMYSLMVYPILLFFCNFRHVKNFTFTSFIGVFVYFFGVMVLCFVYAIADFNVDTFVEYIISLISHFLHFF